MKPLPKLSVTFGLLRLVHLKENSFGLEHLLWLFELGEPNPHISSDVIS